MNTHGLKQTWAQWSHFYQFRQWTQCRGVPLYSLRTCQAEPSQQPITQNATDKILDALKFVFLCLLKLQSWGLAYASRKYCCLLNKWHPKICTPHFTSPYLTSPHLTLPHLTLPYLTWWSLRLSDWCCPCSDRVKLIAPHGFSTLKGFPWYTNKPWITSCR